MVKMDIQNYTGAGCYWDTLTQSRLENPLFLENYGYKVYSQNDEDGIIAEIFNRIGTTDKRFIEFGVQDGLESNTHYLLFKGWSGLWIDGCSASHTAIQNKFRSVINSGQLIAKNHFITKDNINSIFKENGFCGEIDLLSIDVDGNDYHIWNTIDAVYPRVVIIEYNAKFSPDCDWYMPYRENHVWDGTDKFSASLKAYERLGRDKGYQLVATNISGVNAFFVRTDLAGNLFPQPDSAENLYNPFRVGKISFSSGFSATRCLLGNIDEENESPNKPQRSYADLSTEYSEHYYLQDCGGYDEFNKSGGKLYHTRLASLGALAGIVKDKNVLDIGCGRGELTNWFYEMGANATGIDYSHDAINIANSTFAHNLGTGLQFKCVDALEFQGQEKFHRIILADVVEHIEQDFLDKLTQHISSTLLDDDGYALFHTAPNKLYNLGRPKTYYEDLMHINEQTPDSLDRTLKQHFPHVIVWSASDTQNSLEWFNKDCPYDIMCNHVEIYAVAANSEKPLLELSALIEEIRNYQLSADDVDIDIKTVGQQSVSNDHIAVKVEIKNNSKKTIRQFTPTYPVNISYHILDENDNVVFYDGLRTRLLYDIPPLANIQQDMYIDKAHLNVGNKAIITLVQEGAFWFDDIDKRFSCSVNLEKI